ncbi:MAG: rRNA maturation RNase YbeY [Betaproteobacteria bacterium]|nr:rRNA maturation RNase YbeY [Betaproteobacteria bacterium]MDE2047926.1 rRNA maturation RNase YbeY [Betaproteobacteria bacterium]
MSSVASNALELRLQFADARHRALLPHYRVRRWVQAALECDAVLTLRFVGDAEGRALNRTFRGKDYATNVLTFDYAHRPVQADIVLCSPVVAREARAQGKPLLAHYAHLVMHGVLHAQGYDHEQPRDAERMEAREVALLARFRLPDPYA